MFFGSTEVQGEASDPKQRKVDGQFIAAQWP